MTLDGPVPSPASARNVEELVTAMRALKEHSGLSLRQLGERAEAQGDVLARSTLADVLNRSALPRPEMLAAFVRACGGGEMDVREWLAARERIAVAPPAAEPPVPPADAAADAAAPRSRRGLVLGAAGAALAVLLTAGAWALWPDDDTAAGSAGSGDTAGLGVIAGSPGLGDIDGSPGLGDTAGSIDSGGTAGSVGEGDTAGSDDTAGSAGSDDTDDPGPSAPPFPDGEVEIRSVGAPELCLTEGLMRSGEYGSAIAVQGPCGEATGPRTYLRAVGQGDWYFVEWEHAVDHGVGCLTLRAEEPGAGLLEPYNRDQCGPERAEQHFRLEPADGVAGPQGEPVYLLRNAGSDECLAFADGGQAPGEEAVQAPCTGDSAHAFLITPAS